MKKLETDLIHQGYEPESATGAVTMPIVLSTTFERAADGSFMEGRDIYSRSSNPNRRALEEKLALLEKGTEAMAFSSGQAATMSIMHTLQSGDHIILPDDIYYGTKVLLQNLYSRFGLEYDNIDMTNPDLVRHSIKPNTKLIWIETPSNPSLKITDIGAIVSIAKEKNIITACDNTWATPFYTNPFGFGIDLIMHSSTKYFGGHSDIIGGAVIVNGNESLAQKIRDFQILGGAVPSSFDSWLLCRSLATFPIRMKVHGENAMALALYLNSHPKIEKVNYPGLASNEYHSVAATQMKNGFGGMLSILVKGGAPEALRLASNLNTITHATSLGGVESLVDHRQSAEGAHSVSPPNLLRVSVGIENIEDLIRDFDQALALSK